MTKATLATLISVAIAFAIGITGCGGGGGSTTGGSPLPLTCGTNFRTPNYVTADNPVNGQPNRLYYWASFPVRVFFADEVSATFNGVTYNTTDLFMEAATRWTTASGGGATFTEVGSSAQAQIVVNIGQLSSSPGPGDTLGFTQVTYYTSNQQIASADITINVWPGMTRAEFVDGLRRTTLHEFGHAIFLRGHSDSINDIMFPSSPKDEDGQLSQRDINSFLTTYCNNFSGSAVTVRGLPGEEPVTVTIE